MIDLDRGRSTIAIAVGVIAILLVVDIADVAILIANEHQAMLGICIFIYRTHR
jgi:hypothetical protein